MGKFLTINLNQIHVFVFSVLKSIHIDRKSPQYHAKELNSRWFSIFKWWTYKVECSQHLRSTINFLAYWIISFLRLINGILFLIWSNNDVQFNNRILNSVWSELVYPKEDFCHEMAFELTFWFEAIWFVWLLVWSTRIFVWFCRLAGSGDPKPESNEDLLISIVGQLVFGRG